MKITALTDIHGAYELANEIIKKESPDILIIAGDLTTVGTVKEVQTAIAHFKTLTKQIFCISGNMDLPQHDKLYEQLGVSLNGKGLIYNSIGFFGVSASTHSSLKTPYEISENEITNLLFAGYQQIVKSKTKILVSHAPPFGTKVDITHSGLHVGSMAIRDFIEETKPDVVICGHIHEARGQDVIEKSKIVNCGQASNGYYAVIEILEETIQIKNSQYFRFS